MNKSLDIITIGECLLELSTKENFENTECFQFSFGGDVLSSAVAASCFGAKTGIITTIGDDYFKNTLFEKMINHNLELSHARVCPEKNGLYIIGQSDKQELITYRRRVASNLLGLEDYSEEYLNSAKAIYTTGITQSLSPQACLLIKKCFEYAKNNDILTAYDPNYTSHLMTAYDTKEYLEDIVQNIDIVFMSLKNDADALFELSSVEKIINYFKDKGAKIIVIKSYLDHGYFVHNNGNTLFCEFFEEQQNSNVRGAGDIFNGCFLAAITKGYTPIESARFASKQAGMYMKTGKIQELLNFEELMRI